MNATQHPADHRPPPPPSGPPAPPRSSAATGPSRGPWRDRLPELVATMGTSLVVVSIVGFVTSSWDQLLTVHKAMTLAAVAVGLTVVGVYVESARRRSMSRVVALGSALLYAAGPAGTAVADRFSTMDPLVLAEPVVGLFDPAVRTDLFVVPGTGWAAIGVAVLLLGLRVEGRARHAATVFATGTLFAAAAMLNVATDPLGAFAALCIVVGYLLHGLVAERPGVPTIGAIGVLVAGIRVIWGLFSGQVAVTVAALAVGVAMLAWAVRAARSRPDN